MNIKRMAKHLFMTQGQVRRTFPRSALKMIEGAIKASEAEHTGVVGGVQAVTHHLVTHSPMDGRSGNELPDKPVLM